jgi:pimeloyl-ACP methyl ester carboxylesterase
MAETGWRDGIVHANGIRLHYFRTGGKRPPVVMAHGITDNGLCWSRLARALEADFDLIMVDARGHGESDKPEQGYSPDDHAADLAGLIEALGLARPGVIGHSMGAGTAATLLATYPGLTAGAVLEDPPWRMPGSAAAGLPAAEWAADIERRKALAPEALAAEGKKNNPAWADEEFPAWVAAKQQVSSHVVQFVGQPRTPWSELVARIREPVLLVCGDPERGGIIDQTVAGEVIRINPQITVVHLPGAGHNIRREQFTAYVTAVSSFLTSLVR